MNFKIGDVVRIKKKLPEQFHSFGISHYIDHWHKNRETGVITEISNAGTPSARVLMSNYLDWWIDLKVLVKARTRSV